MAIVGVPYRRTELVEGIMPSDIAELEEYMDAHALTTQ